MLFALLSRAVIAALAAAPLLVLADKSPQAPTSTYDGCRPSKAFLDRTAKMINKHGPNSHGSHLAWWRDDGIQMGECFANMRVMNHVFSSFVINPNKWTSEGAPYGSCIGFAVMPTAHELEADPVNNWSCGFWGDKDSDPVPSSIPGALFTAPAIVCSHNIGKCYSDAYYEPGGVLGALGSKVNDYSGRIYGPEDNNGKQLYCDCFNCGCKAPTLLEYATRNTGCDVSQCTPWKGAKSGSFSDYGNKGSTGGESSSTYHFGNDIEVGTESGVNAHNARKAHPSDGFNDYTNYNGLTKSQLETGTSTETKVEYKSGFTYNAGKADKKKPSSKSRGDDGDDEANSSGSGSKKPSKPKAPKVKKPKKQKPKKEKHHVHNMRRSF